MVQLYLAWRIILVNLLGLLITMDSRQPILVGFRPIYPRLIGNGEVQLNTIQYISPFTNRIAASNLVGTSFIHLSQQEIVQSVTISMNGLFNI